MRECQGNQVSSAHLDDDDDDNRKIITSAQRFTICLLLKHFFKTSESVIAPQSFLHSIYRLVLVSLFLMAYQPFVGYLMPKPSF